MLDFLPLIYIAGPYTPPPRFRGWRSSRTAREAAVLAHLEHAAHWGREVMLRGGFPVIPHATGVLVTNDVHEVYGHGGAQALTDEATWRAGDLLLLRACHGAVFIPGWESSVGARAEHEEAVRLGMPVALLSARDPEEPSAAVRFCDPSRNLDQRFDQNFDEALALLATGASLRRQSIDEALTRLVSGAVTGGETP